MKILEVIPKFHPAVGGSEKVVYELSKQFVKDGHEVTVVTSTSTNNKDVRGFSTEGIFRLSSSCNSNNHEIIDNINVYRFRPIFKFFPYSYNPSMKKFLKKNAGKYDIIHSHVYQSYEADVISSLGLAYVHTAHDIVSHYGGIFKFFKKIYDLIIGRRILKNAKYLIALTPENEKQYLEIRHSPEKIKVIPDGIEHMKKAPKSKELLKKYGNPEKIVLFVGRLVKYKGAQYIIKAIPEIIKFDNKISFLFVGEDQGYLTQLKEEAARLNVSHKCIFTGMVKNIESHFNLADIFVLPSRGEGFGLAAVEALSLGKPSILADSGGLKYVLREIGGYALNMEKNVSKQISKYIIEILSDSKIKEKLNKAEYNACKYKWENISKKNLELFKKCINKSKYIKKSKMRII